jgi:hypothetical protein
VIGLLLLCNARQDSIEKCGSYNTKFWIWQVTRINFIKKRLQQPALLSDCTDAA